MNKDTSQIHQTDHRSVKTDQTSIQVLMTSKFKAFLGDTVKQIGYGTISEFIRDAIRRRLEDLGISIDYSILTSGVEEPIE